MKATFAFGIAFALILLAAAAWAAPRRATIPVVCDARAPIVDWLAAEHGEVVQQAGIAGAGAGIAELSVSPGGTWTLMITMLEDGQTCVIASGDQWQAVPQAPTGNPA